MRPFSEMMWLGPTTWITIDKKICCDQLATLFETEKAKKIE